MRVWEIVTHAPDACECVLRKPHMHRGYQPGVSASVAVLLSMLAGKPAQHTEGHKCWWPMHLKHPDSRRSSADLGHTVPHHTQQTSMLANWRSCSSAATANLHTHKLELQPWKAPAATRNTNCPTCRLAVQQLVRSQSYTTLCLRLLCLRPSGE